MTLCLCNEEIYMEIRERGQKHDDNMYNMDIYNSCYIINNNINKETYWNTENLFDSFLSSSSCTNILNNVLVWINVKNQ